MSFWKYLFGSNEIEYSNLTCLSCRKPIPKNRRDKYCSDLCRDWVPPKDISYYDPSELDYDDWDWNK